VETLKLCMTFHLVYADDVNSLGEYINTIKHTRFIGYAHEAIKSRLHCKIASYYSVQKLFLPASYTEL